MKSIRPRHLPLLKPSCMIFMSPSIPATQFLLEHCTVALIWAWMSLRASNSRSMVIDNEQESQISKLK